jgi:hypothetical protein
LKDYYNFKLPLRVFYNWWVQMSIVYSVLPQILHNPCTPKLEKLRIFTWFCLWSQMNSARGCRQFLHRNASFSNHAVENNFLPIKYTDYPNYYCEYQLRLALWSKLENPFQIIPGFHSFFSHKISFPRSFCYSTCKNSC